MSDDKSNRVVVPPIQVYDIPMVDPHKPRNYRSFKIQFQAPQGVGLYTWRLRLISDTYVGEEVIRDLTVSLVQPKAYIAILKIILAEGRRPVRIDGRRAA